MRIIIVAFTMIVLLGCDNVASTSKSSKISDEKSQIWMENIMNEEVALLAIKYGIEKDQLNKILSEYDSMVSGYSMSNLFGENGNYSEESKKVELVSVSEAISHISSRHQIPKDKLAAIIIERKSMEVCDYY